MKRIMFVLVVIIGIYFLMRSPSPKVAEVSEEVEHPQAQSQILEEKKLPLKDMEVLQTIRADETTQLRQNPREESVDAKASETTLESMLENTVQYEKQGDLAVVDGDIVLGVPKKGTATGRAPLEEIHLWERGIVPYHIQADIQNKADVIRALAMFADSGISFVPYEDQEDVLVFESSSRGCKSYLGKVGGKQPIWISGGCGPSEIAHEIMHALGFIHEQNRTDRDNFVEVLWENVQEKYRINFEIFPAFAMKVSGLAPFDYESIMIYQPTAFAKQQNLETIKSTSARKTISPSNKLSPLDLLRIKRVYR